MDSALLAVRRLVSTAIGPVKTVGVTGVMTEGFAIHVVAATVAANVDDERLDANELTDDEFQVSRKSTANQGSDPDVADLRRYVSVGEVRLRTQGP
jgi:hypothetical protein